MHPMFSMLDTVNLGLCDYGASVISRSMDRGLADHVTCKFQFYFEHYE